jgi:serine/threonine protein phosphatase PrpC
MEYPPPRRNSALSERVYRLLLLAYPRAFREEYASEMLLVFQDAYRKALCKQGILGILGVLSFWRDFFCDFIKTVCIEHARHWTQRGARDFLLVGKHLFALTPQFTLDIAQHTDIGLTRASNEDDVIAVVPQDRHLLRTKGVLFVVSDGMANHSHGEVASKLTIENVKEYYYQKCQDDIPTTLQEAIKQANSAICQANTAKMVQRAKDFDIGATCAAAVLHDRMLYVANVGDSRVYVLHQDQLRQITRDHSQVAQFVERGEITPAQARIHEKRHLIYRWLGLPDVEIDLFAEEVCEGDTVILCTDGLCGVVEDEALRAIVEQYDPAEGVQHLIAQANAEGGPDNVTAIVIRISAV